MNKHLFHIGLIVLLSSLLKAQIVFINNPANHVVSYNPAFSAIEPHFNYNYVPGQLGASSRVSKNQSDGLLSAQYFFTKKNLGISAHYNFVNQNKSTFQKAGIGLSYQLLFFNKISTGWGISLNYNQLMADSNAAFQVYNEKRAPTLQKSNYTTLTFGALINYEKLLFGFSIQPNECVFLSSSGKGTYYTSGSVHIKYRYPINRKLNAAFCYNLQWNKANHLLYLNGLISQEKIQAHALNVHVSGRKGLIGGVGCRLTNFNYTSVIAKIGYNAKHWQLTYGVEPYWLHSKYSEIIHELSFTFKFN